MEKCFAHSKDKNGVIENMQKYCDSEKCDYEIHFDDGSTEQVIHGEKKVSKEDEIEALRQRLKELGV